MQQEDIKRFMELLSQYDSGQFDEEGEHLLFRENAIKSALQDFEPSIPNTIKDEKPIIEVYYDPTGFRGGKIGCIRTRLKDDHKIHSAGMDEKEAVADILSTLRSRCRPSRREDYMYKNISPPQDR